MFIIGLYSRRYFECCHLHGASTAACGVDRFLVFENIVEDYAKLAGDFPLIFHSELGHWNKSHHSKWSTYYTPALRKLVKNADMHIFQKFYPHAIARPGSAEDPEEKADTPSPEATSRRS